MLTLHEDSEPHVPMPMRVPATAQVVLCQKEEKDEEVRRVNEKDL